MLNNLFGSKTRVKILNLMMINDDNQYYLRQIARELDLQVNAVSRELNNLYNLGIVSVAEMLNKKNKKYYQANRNYLLFKEIRALFIKAQILSTQQFASNLQKVAKPKFIVLTGFFTNDHSVATDILIVGKIKKIIIEKEIKGLEKELGKEVRYTILNEKEFNYRRDVVDIFLYNILKSKKIILIDNFDK